MKKAYLIAPLIRAGSGWLHNCLLELGIKVDNPKQDLWIPDGEAFRSAPYITFDNKLRLPIASRIDRFFFRPDIVVIMGHHLPTFPMDPGSRGIFLTRDFRDAFLSDLRERNYRGENKTFREFAAIPGNSYMMNFIDENAILHQWWRNQDNVLTIRFEDTKADGAHALTRIVHYLGLDYPPFQIAQAAENSSFAKARDAEAAHLKEVGAKEGEIFLHNRAGKVGEHKELSGDDQLVLRDITVQSADLMTELGYELPPDSGRGESRLYATQRIWPPKISPDAAQVLREYPVWEPDFLARHPECINVQAIAGLVGIEINFGAEAKYPSVLTLAEISLHRAVLENLRKDREYALWSYELSADTSTDPKGSRLFLLCLYVLLVCPPPGLRISVVSSSPVTLANIPVVSPGAPQLSSAINILFGPQNQPQAASEKVDYFELVNACFKAFDDTVTTLLFSK